MITALDFIAKDVFEELIPVPGIAVISIGDPASMPPPSLVHYDEYLRLEFLDLEPDDLELHGIPEEALCQLSQVQHLVNFVQALQVSSQAWRLVIHCNASTSQSAAAALIAAELTAAEFPRRPDAHFANAHVLALGEALLGRPIPRSTKQEGIAGHEYLRMALQI